MPLPIDVKPYELKGVIGGDNYLTHYKASDAEGEEFIITEFYPAYMVKREDDGTLNVSERFSKEFVADREEFIRRAESISEIRDASLHPTVEIFERNKTAYIVRRACGMTVVDHFMGSQTMDYDEAYHFIRPMLVCLAQVGNKGAYFNIQPTDFKVNKFKNLVLAAPIAWENDFHPTIIQVARLYYKLLTGVDAPDSGVTAFSAYGIEVPPRIESLVMEILNGDILYGSLDDFYKKFKSLIDGTAQVSTGVSEKTLSIMRGVAASLFVLFAISLTVLTYGAVRAFQSGSFWADPEVFSTPSAIDEPAFDFSEITLTHPRSNADALTGSVARYGDSIFFRGEGGMNRRLVGGIAFIPGAAGMLALGEEALILPGTQPSFIVGRDSYIYFADTSSEGRLYRSATTGAGLTRLTEFPVLNLAIIDDYLYYTNPNHNHHLYRVNLDTNENRLVFPHPVYATLASDEILFFTSRDPGTGDISLHSWNTEDEDSPVLRIAANVNGGLRVFNEALFFLNDEGRIRSINFAGRPIAVHSPENVRTFDVFFQWIIFTEEGYHVPRAYNMDTGQFHTLSTTEWASYIFISNNEIFAVDHRNPNLIHTFGFPAS